MKKSLKLLFVVLSLFGMTLAGCSESSNSGNNTHIVETDDKYEIYKLYKASGGTMSYEEWLESIKGADGSSLLTGTTNPDSSTGNNGDTYINTTTWDVFVKSGGNWAKVGNIMGPQGPQGEQGPQGPQGEPGQNGQDGTSVLTGEGKPTSELGKDGDSYIDTLTWDYYVKAKGLWVKKGNIKGESAQDTTSAYTVNFFVDGSMYYSVEITGGQLLEKPSNPTKECKNFVGWFDENDDKWVFNAFTVNKNLDLFAKYEDAHVFNKKVCDYRYRIKAETCEESGIYYYSCECGECGDETFMISPHGHEFEHNWCNYCNTNICDLFEYSLGLDFYNDYEGGKYVGYYYFVYQHLWDIYLNMPTSLESIDVEIFSGLTFEEAATVACKVIIDNPLFYFADQSFTYDSMNNKLIIGVPDAYKQLTDRTLVQNEIDNFLTNVPIKYDESEIDILTKIHDYIITRIDYEYDINNNPSSEAYAHNIIGIVESTGAVCEGYSKMFQLLCTYFNIPCYVVTGKTHLGENHAWNLVQADGEWYWCDLTWDDLNYTMTDWYSADGEEFYNQRYANFLVSDKSFCAYHIVGTTFSSTEIPFVYELPERAKKDYFENHERSNFETFEVDNISYQFIDKYSVTVTSIDTNGDTIIPSKIEFKSQFYNVVSIGTYFSGNRNVSEGTSTLKSYNNQSMMIVGPNVTSITIPASVRTIVSESLTSEAGLGRKTLFPYAQNHLQNIYVDSNNDAFCSVDGVLYTKDKSVLVAFPFDRQQETFVLDERTYSISENALCGYYSNVKDVYYNSVVLDLAVGSVSYLLGTTGGKIHIDENNPYYYVNDGLIYMTYCIYSFCSPIHEYTSTLIGMSDVNQESYTLIESFEKDGKEYFVDYFGVNGFAEFKNETFYGLQGTMFDLTQCATNFICQNPLFEFENGCLYYNNNILYLSPEVKEFVVSSERFDKVLAYSFIKCDNLESVIISDGVLEIEQGAFYDCKNLKSVTIPLSVTQIHHFPFELCPNFQEIYYEGTKDQWLRIIKNDSWNSWIEEAVIHCTDGDLIAGRC